MDFFGESLLSLSFSQVGSFVSKEAILGQDPLKLNLRI
jgi:hypothetical protein